MEDLMNIPPSSDKRWTEVVTGKIAPEWSVLAMKIMMFRVVASTKSDSSENNINNRIQEVRIFMEKNIRVVQPDIIKIFK